MIMMFLFNPTKNLLLARHEKIVNHFIAGKIDYIDFENYEKRYEKTKYLYIINLKIKDNDNKH